MDVLPTGLAGCYLLVPSMLADERGMFVKTFNRQLFAAHGLSTGFQESYYTRSHPGVVRGMHFQAPPHAHAKLVYCVQGRVLDVALDLRPGVNYGQHASFELSAANGHVLYLPMGLAHGFMALEEATLVYLTTTVYNPEVDAGIRWDSFGYNWPLPTPLTSARDQSLPVLAEFSSPF